MAVVLQRNVFLSTHYLSSFCVGNLMAMVLFAGTIRKVQMKLFSSILRGRRKCMKEFCSSAVYCTMADFFLLFTLIVLDRG